MLPEFHPFVYLPTDLDDTALADWLVKAVHDQPKKTTLIAAPVFKDDAEMYAAEDDFRRAFELARKNGHALAVKFLAGIDTNGPTPGADRLGIFLHEHRWVGGECVNGFGETREVA